MIDIRYLSELAKRYQTTELNIRREYIQHLVLSYFYQQKGSDSIFFKGGTALRMIYKSVRFSEDLDFSASFFDLTRIEDIVLNTLEEVERGGIKVNIVESKKTTGGYLARLNFLLQNETLEVILEVSRRLGRVKGEVQTIVSDFIPPYTVMVLLQEKLVEEKIKALVFRQKARDFYDLYFILRANLLSPKSREVLSRALTVVSKTRLDFGKELKEFLPKSHWPIIKDFKRQLAREIERFI